MVSVCTMFVIIRTPSSSSTTAIAYGHLVREARRRAVADDVGVEAARPLTVTHSTSDAPQCGQTGRG